MAQMKAFVGVITEVRGSIVANMSTNSSKKHLGSILVNIEVTIIYCILLTQCHEEVLKLQPLIPP